ncbi:glycosyltransferase family 4 protein [Bacillus sp. FJAT-49736]|uniref:glycosyltransferase family 4 protein n=1 Tax=Bacillus sp. FJAT-49736 TaxID=2833582 RepID=UPI001BC9D101|nr:glycosyltransferase family 4 protein [Bacillus sp. FJAT-49736]MBS4172213.1 glycosyltransferase family 4 protein [Bacillus sp. FJAT-49736]
MKIFHGTVEIAGQMGILSSALNKKGHYSIGYNTFHSYLGYEDCLINTDQPGLEESFEEICDTFDLFHFHYGSSIFRDLSDLPELKRLGKKMVMHHWGNDVRFHDKARNHNPFVYTGDSPPNEVIHEKLKTITTFIKEAIVQDYEVYDYVKDYYEKVHVVPIAIDLVHFHPHFPAFDKKRPLLLHAPTNRDFKGTQHVEKAIEVLKEEFDFEFVMIEKMNHEEAIKLYREADIIVDQFLCGSYGLLSVEAMALGKPVLTYIRPDLINTFPEDLPIVNTNPDTLYDNIKLLLHHPELRIELGKKGRKYVENVHSHDVVVEKLLNIYSQLND